MNLNMTRRITKIMNYGVFVVFLLGLMSCQEDPPLPTTFETHYLPTEAKQLFFSNVGDTLIYRDSISGVYDTAFCTRGGYQLIKSTYDGHVLFEEEAIVQTYYHTFHRKDFYYISRLLLFKDGRKYFDITESGSDIFLRFPLTVGDSLPNGGSVGYSKLSAFYPTIQIDGKLFSNVYLVKRKVVYARSAGDADYYLARGKGIIAIRDYKSNKLWVLQ
ncbi:MAG: hypothetical protein ACK417_11790 [Bacteroidia bacterium]